MGDTNDPKLPKKILTFLAPFIVFALWKIYQISPMVFAAFATLVGSGIVLSIFNRLVRRVVSKRCALCGGVMTNFGQKSMIEGSIDQADGSKLDAIMMSVYRCDKCENEYWELDYLDSSMGDLADYKTNMIGWFPIPLPIELNAGTTFCQVLYK